MKRLRALRGVSQHDLAVAVGVTDGAVSNYERGINTPRRRVAAQMDDHLRGDGAILEGFGYLVSPPDESGGGWATLEQHVRLQDQVDSLIARVQELDAEVARLRRRADRDEK